jgi:ubiquinone/menaquinone biosynthesis C-methylase UbiE
LPVNSYIMESECEAYRLDLKTETQAVVKQANLAGLKPGMRVADVGCGSGKTTFILHDLVQPYGEAVGIDGSQNRVLHAKKNYQGEGLSYHCRDFYEPLTDLGKFDFVWVRFVLEYHRKKAFDIVKNISEMLKPGGILCLIDLDYNCLSHFGIPPRLEMSIFKIMENLQNEADFDPYMGRKLYSFLYDLGFKNIGVELFAHHLIMGNPNEVDVYNWTCKIQVAAKNSGYDFAAYEGGFDEFCDEFLAFFQSPRRFTYTPLILCWGKKPF